MNYIEAAAALDSADQPVAAAWAYELVLSRGGGTLSLCLDLAALYTSACDPGFAAHHHLPEVFLGAAYPRAREVLDLATAEFGDHPDIKAWRLHLEERVTATPIDPARLRELAEDPRGEFAKVLAYAEHVLPAAAAEQVFVRAAAASTERQRYCLSYAPRAFRRS